MFFFEAVDSKTGVNFNIVEGSAQGAGVNKWTKMIKEDYEKEGVEILEEGPLSFVIDSHVYFKVKKIIDGKPIIQSNFIRLNSQYDVAYMMNYTCPEEFAEEFGIYEMPIFLSFHKKNP